MKLFLDAGLPAGVINFLPGDGGTVGNEALRSRHLAGIHFTGSTPVFSNMWKIVGGNITPYRCYPRIVGETGGKDFVFAHETADVVALGVALIRGAFEYQGQKCSAVSRAYIPRSIWNDLRDFLESEIKSVRVGGVEDFRNFINAVIDKEAFDKITGYIEYIKESPDAAIIFGGSYDDSVGYFIEPTAAVTTDPHFRTMEEEIFGPVLSIFIYDDSEYERTLHICDETSPYGLTGAVFSKDREAIAQAKTILVNAAGNFYINDKPTGAVVGQQPFGGSRGSGTNDKAGSLLNIQRWVTPRTIKENYLPSRDYRYPFMSEE